MRSTRSQTGKQSGVVLLEVLIALLLFSLGILGLVSLLTTATQSSTDSRFRTEAAAAADAVIAEMQTSNRNTLEADFATGGPRYAAWKNRTIAASAPTPLPDGDATIAFVPNAALQPNALVATVTITWNPQTEKQLGAGADTRRHVAMVAIGPPRD